MVSACEDCTKSHNSSFERPEEPAFPYIRLFRTAHTPDGLANPFLLTCMRPAMMINYMAKLIYCLCYSSQVISQANTHSLHKCSTRRIIATHNCSEWIWAMNVCLNAERSLNRLVLWLNRLINQIESNHHYRSKFNVKYGVEWWKSISSAQFPQ